MAVWPVALLLLSILQTTAARWTWLCSWTDESATRRWPRGWRTGLGNLHRLLGCDQDDASRSKRPRSEDYLKGLEHPGAYFRADFKKAADEKIGFDVSRKSDYLEVDKVSQSGGVSRWNAANSGRAILAGDRIVAVNSVEGNATLMASELRASADISLRVLRPSAEDRRRMETRRREEKVKKILREVGPSGLGHGIPEPSGSSVAVLHAKNIDRFIAAQPVALIMFYANWCGHCREMAPEFTKAADLVKQLELPKSVRLAKFDDGDGANQQYKAGSPDKFNFTSYPSFVYVVDGKHEGFYGADGAQEIAAQVAARVKGLDIESEVKEVVFKMRPMLYRPDVADEVVQDLEPESFDDLVLKSAPENNRVWIIEFYSDKCPFCKSLKPEIIKASETLKKEAGAKVKLAAVNSRAFGLLAERFGVTSYPWIISIYAGQKLEDMAGLGGAQSVIDWAKRMLQKAWKKEPKWNEELPPWPLSDPKKAEGEASYSSSSSSSSAASTWRELLGQRTWFFLHTVAAKYPDEPTEADQAAVTSLIAALGQHYPCPICRRHLREKLLGKELGLPPTSSRQELAQWFCRLHNMVNAELNKTHFSCNPFELDLRYLKSCEGCSAKSSPAEPADGDGPAAAFDFLGYLAKAAPASSPLASAASSSSPSGHRRAAGSEL